MNINNLAQHVNIICGSPDLELTPMFVQSLTLPGVSLSLPEHSSRSGTRAVFSSDTITYNPLNLTILTDENFEVYFEFMDKVFKTLNIQKSTFDNSVVFGFFIVVTNNKGYPIFRYDFHGCRIESVGDIAIDMNDDTAFNTFNVDLKYEYYTKSLDTDDIKHFLEKLKEPVKIAD